jgi:lon-related putative ATP-dependent protease
MSDSLSPEEFYRVCDADSLKFRTTAEIEPQYFGTIGQDRAMRAIDFGLGLESKGFNIFVLGDSGTGKMTTIRRQVMELAEKEPVPDDLCYVFNFKDPDVPTAVSLGPGRAVGFKGDMRELVDLLKVEIPRVFESKEYDKSRSSIFEEFQKKQKVQFGGLEEEVKAKGFNIRKTVSGLVIVPVSEAGEPLSEEDFEALEQEHKDRIEKVGRQFQERLDDVVRTVKVDEKDVKKSLETLERDAAISAVGHQIDDLKDKYREHEKITDFLEQVQEDILAHLEDFKGGEDAAAQSPIPYMKPPKAEPTYTRYEVNILVNNEECRGAPCVIESNPTYYNLFGRIEHKFQYGMAVTDFSMIKAGALHRANGGYIIIEVADLLKNLFSYDALKRSLRNREIRMEDIWEQYRLMTTTTLKPEAIALDVKVILIGNPYVYYMLYNLDEDYREMFKVKADFDSVMDRNGGSIAKYSEFVASKCKEEGLLHFDRSGMARVIEHGSRLAEHREKLSSKFSEISDLLRESHYWAKKDGCDAVSAGHVEKALWEKTYRNRRLDDRMREMMAEDTLIVETAGGRVGQVNGLAVLSMGDYSFGKPSRITAKTFAGKAGVLNIERETKMSGKIHDKAILIINNYLGGKYALRKPISLSASITFEQLYEMIEGDSATCAELYALLSSLGNVPLKQNIAVTGSMDQNGDVQPIGGVNEKIEGFFDLCHMRGLDGSHGVIIPRRNVRNLMLKKEVVEAARDGKFHVYPIDRMEDGIEILMAMPPGEPGENGDYPEGTLNHLVSKRLEEINEAMKPRKDDRKEEQEENSDK